MFTQRLHSYGEGVHPDSSQSPQTWQKGHVAKRAVVGVPGRKGPEIKMRRMRIVSGLETLSPTTR